MFVLSLPLIVKDLHDSKDKGFGEVFTENFIETKIKMGINININAIRITIVNVFPSIYKIVKAGLYNLSYIFLYIKSY